MSLKILLINPPYHTGVIEASGTWLPISLFYVAGALSTCHEVRVLDAMNEFKDLADIELEVRNFKPDIVATGTFTASHNTGIEVLRTAKRVDKNIITVIGGLHPSFMYKQVFEQDGASVDVVIRGEGEETFRELANKLEGSTGLENADLSEVKGLAFVKNDEVIATPPRPFLEDLDKYPPAWHLIDWNKYFFRPYRSRFAVTTSSRGCIQNCSFCSQKLFWQQRWRGRDPLKYVSELEMLHQDHGVDTFMLTDEIPTYDRTRWIEILNLLKKKRMDARLLIETRVDDILRDEDILPLYRDANVVHVYVGVESTDQATLDMYKKDLKTEQSKRALDLLNAHDIITETSLVVGTPNETPESLQRTLELAKYFGPDLAFFLAVTPWPYSDIYQELNPFIEERDLSKYNLIEPVVKPQAMTRAELKQALHKCFKEFYMDKLSRFDELSPFKRHYMSEVTKLLTTHSYLAKEMKEMAGDGERQQGNADDAHRKMEALMAKVLGR